VNNFTAAAKRLIERNGISCTYTTVTPGAYDVNTSSVTNTEVNTTLVSYMKHVVANQFNFPNMIGKDVGEFYILASSLSSKPKPADKLLFSGNKYTVQSVREYHAGKELVFYTVIAVKS
jgi:hypothetical protein